MEEIWNLRDTNLLSKLSPEEVTSVLNTMPMANYRAGEYLFHTGEAADCLYLLQAGTVKVSYITLNGDEKILGIFQSGDIFGELFLSKYRHRIGDAQALEDVTVCRLTESDFLVLLERFPQFGLNFIYHLVDEQRETIARLHTLMRTEALYRLLGTLLSIARRYCCTNQEWFELNPSLTQEDIANMAGINRSTVSSLVNDLRRQGVLGGTGRLLKVNQIAVEKILEDAGLEVLV